MSLVTNDEHASIAAAIGGTSTPTADRLSLATLVDLSALDALPNDATPESIEAALVRVRESLPAETDRLTWETTRETIRRQYRHVPARMLNAALVPPPRPTTVPPSTRTQPAPMQGAAVLLRDVERWPEAVNGAELLGATAVAVRRYVVVSPEQADTIALWIAMAYTIDVLGIAPILLVSSPTMRAGKTTLCIVLGALTPRSILISSVTPAVLYRLIEQHRPTLIGDEADTWLTDERSELRGILNAGHTRATATVARCVGDGHEVRLYSVWCPRVLAMIGRAPNTIRDRGIAIELRRRTADEAIARLRADRIEDELLPLQRQWKRWAADHADRIRTADLDTPSGLHDRAADCWRPLLAISDLAGGDWPKRARSAAVASSDAAANDEAIAELLIDIRDYLADHDDEIVSSAALVGALTARPDRPWATWRHGRPMTERALARQLAPLGIHPGQYRPVGGRPVRGYRRAAWDDAIARYLPSQVIRRDIASIDGPVSRIANRDTDSACHTSASVTGPNNPVVRHAVPLADRGSGQSAVQADPWADSPQPPGSHEAAERADARMRGMKVR